MSFLDIRQDQQDFQDNSLRQFPDEIDETQSAYDWKEYILKYLAKLLSTQFGEYTY